MDPIVLLQDWPARQARLRPNALAVAGDTDGARGISYGELESLSNRIAAALIEAGCRRGDRVCLLMDKSPLSMAALLGIYKADCIYVPMDLNNPAERLARIALRCQCRCILADGKTAGKLNSMLGHQVLRERTVVGWLDPVKERPMLPVPCFGLEDIYASPDRPRRYRNGPGDAAHILFTSGSTGEPKGVVITHDNVIGFIRWALGYFGIEAAERLSGHPPLNFDLSVFDIFAAFGAGAELHPVPSGLSLVPHKLAAWIRERELTQWFSVPSLLAYMARFDVLSQDDFPSLKRLLWCGEIFPTPALAYWMKRLPHARFTNLYGPTETTIASSYYTVPRCPDNEREQVPIGLPCAGEELLVLDESLKELPPGEEGELYIAGGGLARGYWQDEEKTGAVFIPDPRDGSGRKRLYRTGDRAMRRDDGLFHYMGRQDEQIKSRGYRIELGEIEAALSAVPRLRESAVVALHTDGFENTRICCAYAAAGEEGPTPVEVRRHLASRLPSYMIPSQWQAMESLPRNGNGKIDRRRVRESFELRETRERQCSLPSN